jgi:hypothetical protein
LDWKLHHHYTVALVDLNCCVFINNWLKRWRSFYSTIQQPLLFRTIQKNNLGSCFVLHFQPQLHRNFQSLPFISIFQFLSFKLTFYNHHDDIDLMNVLFNSVCDWDFDLFILKKALFYWYDVKFYELLFLILVKLNMFCFNR